MTCKRDDQLPMSEQRDRVRTLSGLQAELRSALDERREREHLTVGTLASIIGVGWNEIKGFLGGCRTICGGRILVSSTTYVGRRDLRETIERTACGLSDRMRGLASCPIEAIDLAFALEDVKERHAPELTREEFAQCFESAAPLVLGALQASQESLRALRGDGGQPFRDAFASDALVTRLCGAQAAKRDRIAGKAAVAYDLLGELATHFQFREQQARALGVHRTTLAAVLRGSASEGTIDGLIARAKRLLGERDAAIPTAVAPAAAHTSALEQHGGETSPLGVRFVLGPNSFRELDGDPGAGGIAFAKRQLELVRLTLNLFAQLRDTETRRLVREVLGPEVEELELAVRLFTVEHPNRLTELHRAQRDTWAQQPRAPMRPSKERR